MFRLLASVPDRLTATLCVALMLFYAAMMPAKAVDRIQHASALAAPHDHVALSSFSVEAVCDDHAEHVDHHEDQSDSDGQQDDRLAGGHHHHGDSGPNLLVTDADVALAAGPFEDVHGLRQERPIAGQRSAGPKRPPRSIALNA